MSADRSHSFLHLSDGTILLRQPDGTYKPVQSETNFARLDALTEDEIEWMAANDPDHPALDDAFWANAVDQRSGADASIKLDQDVLSYFQREEGESYQARINAVLRRYVETRQRERS